MNKEIDDQESRGSSEEKGDGGNHSVHPQLLPPLDPHESHDDHIEDTLGTLAQLESSLCRGEEAWSVEFGNDGLSAVVEFECRRVESGETEIPFVTGSVHFERPVKSQWPTAGLLHDLADVLRLEVVLEERIMEVLPLDLGNLDLVSSLLLRPLLALGSVMEWRSNLGDFR